MIIRSVHLLKEGSDGIFHRSGGFEGMAMDSKPAKFVRWVDRGEDQSELINEAKARTWDGWAEHPLIEMESGQLALVSGGVGGIEFRALTEEHRTTLHIEVEGRGYRITRIHWHTHPLVSGPSDGDLEALEILGQAESFLYEIGGDADGTRIRPKFRHDDG